MIVVIILVLSPLTYPSALQSAETLSRSSTITETPVVTIIPQTSVVTNSGAKAVGKLKNRNLDIILVLKFRPGTDPEGYVRSLYDPTSPNYHNFLTPTSFANMFAPTIENYQSVVDWLTTQGFNVKKN